MESLARVLGRFAQLFEAHYSACAPGAKNDGGSFSSTATHAAAASTSVAAECGGREPHSRRVDTGAGGAQCLSFEDVRRDLISRFGDHVTAPALDIVRALLHFKELEQETGACAESAPASSPVGNTSSQHTHGRESASPIRPTPMSLATATDLAIKAPVRAQKLVLQEWGQCILSTYNRVGEAMRDLRVAHDDATAAVADATSRVETLASTWNPTWTASTSSPRANSSQFESAKKMPFLRKSFSFSARRKSRDSGVNLSGSASTARQSATAAEPRERLALLNDRLYQLYRQQNEYELQIARCKVAVLENKLRELDSCVQVFNAIMQCLPANVMDPAEDDDLDLDGTGRLVESTIACSSLSQDNSSADSSQDDEFEEADTIFSLPEAHRTSFGSGNSAAPTAAGADHPARQLLNGYLTKTVGPASLNDSSSSEFASFFGQSLELECGPNSKKLERKSARLARAARQSRAEQWRRSFLMSRFLQENGIGQRIDAVVHANELAWRVRDQLCAAAALANVSPAATGRTAFCFTGKKIVDSLLEMGIVENRTDGCRRALDFVVNGCIKVVQTAGVRQGNSPTRDEHATFAADMTSSPSSSSSSSLLSPSHHNSAVDASSPLSSAGPSSARSQGNTALGSHVACASTRTDAGRVVFQDNFSFYTFRSYPRQVDAAPVARTGPDVVFSELPCKTAAPSKGRSNDDVAVSVPGQGGGMSEQAIHSLTEAIVRVLDTPVEVLFSGNMFNVLLNCLSDTLQKAHEVTDEMKTLEIKLATQKLRPNDRAARLRRLVMDLLKSNVPFLRFSAEFLGRPTDDCGESFDQDIETYEDPLGTQDLPTQPRVKRLRRRKTSLQNTVRPTIDASSQRLFTELVSNCGAGLARSMQNRWRAVLQRWQANPTRRFSSVDLGLFDHSPSSAANGRVGRSNRSLSNMSAWLTSDIDAVSSEPAPPLVLDVATMMRVAAQFAYCVDHQFSISEPVLDRLMKEVAKLLSTTPKQKGRKSVPKRQGQSAARTLSPRHTEVTMTRPALRAALLALLNALVQNMLFQAVGTEKLLLHVIEEKFPTTLVQDTALMCQLDWICRVAPMPEVFGFDIKDVNGVVGNPCAQAVGVFRGITRSWAPHALLEGVTRTLQRIFTDTKCYSRALGADDVFPLIVFLLSHIGCNTISRRLQCASEAIDAYIAQVFHHAHEPLFAYYGLVDDDNTLSELRYYCTAMQVAMEYLCMLRADETVCSSFLSTSLLHAVDVDRSVRLVPPCAATGLGTLSRQQATCRSSGTDQVGSSPGQQNLPARQHTTLFQRISAAVQERSLLRRRRAAAGAALKAPSTSATSTTPHQDQPQPPLVGEMCWNAERNEWSFDLDLGTEPTEIRCELCQRRGQEIVHGKGATDADGHSVPDLEPTRRRVSLISADKTTLSAWQVAFNTCFT